ncbi:hypothetical protein [Shinella sumterensis]|uniref:hypothetical protein n=1 Tax=Shinella sumterensis TaxID=1967501 RepID=UPI003F827911
MQAGTFCDGGKNFYHLDKIFTRKSGFLTSFASEPSPTDPNSLLKTSGLHLFSFFMKSAVEASELGSYTAAHRTRAAALLAADELALGFP